MAKRYTDTDKWKDDWYISLDNDCKIVWQWLLDNCNHAGICKPSIGLLNLMCRVSLTEEDLIKKMDNRVLVLGKIWFIPKFIKFQYPTLLSGKPAIISVVKELFENNLIGIVSELLGNDYTIIQQSFDNHYITIKEHLFNHCQMIKDKDKDMVKDKDRKGVIGEKQKKCISFSKDFCFANFEDGSKQKLGVEQKVLAETNCISPSIIVWGSVY